MVYPLYIRIFPPKLRLLEGGGAFLSLDAEVKKGLLQSNDKKTAMMGIFDLDGR